MQHFELQYLIRIVMVQMLWYCVLESMRERVAHNEVEKMRKIFTELFLQSHQEPDSLF